MKKAISLLLAMSLLLACFVGVICIAEYTTTTETDETADSDLPKIRYYYKDSDGALALTDDSETFDANMASTDSVDVIFELEYPEVDSSGRESLTLESTHEEVNAVKSAYYAKVKAANTAANETFAEENGISTDSDDFTVYISTYSPFVQMSFESYDDYVEYSSEIVALAECDIVSAIDVTVSMEFESESATRSSSETEYPIATAISNINASSDNYSGAGVTVGIMEAYGITRKSQSEEFDDLAIYFGGTLSNDDHAKNVTRIFCGSNGVSPGVDAAYIYCVPSSSYYVSAMDWFADNDCSVINASLSSYASYAGQYIWTSAVMDYYSGMLFITIVAAAGNTGHQDLYYTKDLAMGYNVIAVASTNVSNQIRYTSSYGVTSGVYTRKPTVCAPGTAIVINEDEGSIGSGTSYAAPMVAGVVAKLMCENPSLKLHPEIVMAALIASATPVTGQSNSWDTYAGAGIIDYEKAREAVTNCSTYTFNTDYTGLRATKTASVSTGTRVKVVAFWLTNSMTQSSSDTVVLNNFTNYYINLTTTGGTILSTGSTAFNIEYINYSNSSYSSLKVKLYQSGEKANSYTDYVAVTWVTE
ncbi:MAG: S8/S53 family peptidase [Firmicutes bacterium]|nr:S8/S53 family peptidase [Bacillota bacterium]